VTQFLKTTQIAIDGAKTLPRRYYVDPGIFAEEHERIFVRRWLCVGREDRISSPGDYFLQPVGKESIIVLRDRAEVVRAYYNVCRHRGTRLCEQSQLGVQSRVYQPGPYSKREALSVQFDREVLKALEQR
jgi:phenylpropionate dioxygenase-like ring-hydroxylating dioxygenase large terminal subunit